MSILSQAKSSAEGTAALAVVLIAGFALYYLVKGTKNLTESISQGMQTLGNAFTDPLGTIFPTTQGKTSNAKSNLDLANVDENGTLSVPTQVQTGISPVVHNVDVALPGMGGVADPGNAVYLTGDPYNTSGNVGGQPPPPSGGAFATMTDTLAGEAGAGQ
jgi:hypothetical protein